MFFLYGGSDHTYNTEPFVATWDTRNTSGGSTDSSTIKIPIKGVCDVRIDWGDGSVTTATTATEATHTYASSGIYTTKVYGVMEEFTFESTGDLRKIVAISQWGCFRFSPVGATFRGCALLAAITATDIPDVSNVTIFPRNFAFCYNLTGLANFTDWDTSHITDWTATFESCTNYTLPGAANLITSNVNQIGYMVQYTSFNQDVSNWDVSNVVLMNYTFRSTPFDQVLGGWDISSLTNASGMLESCTLSTANYDSLLIGWEANTHNNNVPFHAGNSKYTSGGAAEAARTALIADGWTITDGGPV